jgi:crotonobetainyl-CoA:carnitine CoA-transferase CaiB-like acyl-CoA transferase
MKPDDRPLPLAGVRVLEWAEGIPGPTAGWLLSECGADVVKIESPAGDRLRSSLGFHALNRGKRGAVIDVESSDDRARFRGLAADADVVIVDEVEERLEASGLGFAELESDSVVWCAAPMFPRSGLWTGVPPQDALAEAACGIAAMQWSYTKTPVWLVTPMVSYATGFAAALGIAAALRVRAATGRGQRVDTNGLAAGMLLQSGTYVRGQGHEGSLAAQASDPRGVFPTYGLYETADGWMFVGALTPAFWTSLATLVGRADLLSDPDLPDNPMAFGRADVRERLRAVLEPIFHAQPTREWLRRFDESDIPGGAVQSRREALAEPNAEVTGAVVEVDDPALGRIRQPGAPVVFEGSTARISKPVPGLGGDAAGFAEREPLGRGRGGRLSSPLEGIRVLDLTSFIAGPLCPMLLADLGADVVKVEAPAGDPFRVASFGFEGWNRGKRALVLDLKSEADRERFLRLVERSDVVVENFRPRVMERLGLGYSRLSERNPRIVYTSISGFGQHGPESEQPGFDPVMQARSGLSRAQGGDDEPVLHQVAYTDYMTGTLAAFATATALFEREQPGRGRRVDVSLFRTSFAMQAAEMVEHDGKMPQTDGGRDLIGRSASYRGYAARDGWIFVAANDARQVSALYAVLGVDLDPAAALAADPRGEVAARIAGAIAARERARLLADLREASVPAAPCLTFAEVFEDEGLRGSGLIRDLDHPRLGRISGTGPYLWFSQTPCIPPRPAPALDEQGAEILAEAGLQER